MIPSIGRIVHYKLDLSDTTTINGLRRDAKTARSDSAHLGMVVRVGNIVSEGDVFPMMIVKTWGATEESAVNGQVFLDGDDVYWVTSVTQGNDKRQWRDPRETLDLPQVS
jgi:hypothetical protein